MGDIIKEIKQEDKPIGKTIQNNSNGNGFMRNFSAIKRGVKRGKSQALASLILSETGRKAVSKSPKLAQYLIDAARDLYLPIIKKTGENLNFSQEHIERKLEACDQFSGTIKRTLPELNEKTRLRLITNFFYHQTLTRAEIAEQYRKEYGEYPPHFLLLSPSMKCNLNCKGCWAKHEKTSMPEEKVNEVLNEAKNKMGIHYIVLTGGEPTMLPYLFDMLEEHSDIAFMAYTNGTLINEKMADKIAEVGNFYPCFSIAGNKEATDNWRGKGVYDKVEGAMARLKERKVFFGNSFIHTKENHESIINENLFNNLIEKGSRFGWFFQYAPVGKEPNPEIAPTPEQRVQRYNLIKKMRDDKSQMLIYDFWMDGPITGGCIGWGKVYAHVNASGGVEPCAFIPFSKDNVYDKTLTECITADWLKDARSRQPFDDNLYAPCPFIDNTEVLRDIVKKHNVPGSYEGAEQSVSGPVYQAVRDNAKAYRGYLTNIGLDARV